MGHVGGHVVAVGEGDAQEEAEFANDRGAGDAIGQSADAGEVVLGFVGAGFGCYVEEAFAGEVVEAIIEVSGTELIQEAGWERGLEKFVGEAQGEVNVKLGPPLAGAGLDEGPVEVFSVVVEGGGEVSEGAESVAGEAVSGQVGALVEEEVFGAEDESGDAGDGGGAEAGVEVGGDEV